MATDDDLLKEYQPRSLRPTPPPKRRSLRFGCGQIETSLDADGGTTAHVGMWAGPYESLYKALEEVGHDNHSVIVRFNPDGTDDFLYQWRKDRWVRWQPTYKASKRPSEKPSSRR